VETLRATPTWIDAEKGVGEVERKEARTGESGGKATRRGPAWIGEREEKKEGCLAVTELLAVWAPSERTPSPRTLLPFLVSVSPLLPLD
jgi:hypothetical protein